MRVTGDRPAPDAARDLPFCGLPLSWNPAAPAQGAGAQHDRMFILQDRRPPQSGHAALFRILDSAARCSAENAGFACACAKTVED
tara:strand:- start:41594 stop:41848 length:255 start_codon:yes stop_codon:yes gene_type:complete